jgi:sugar phosphate isomerase/epimerase
MATTRPARGGHTPGLSDAPPEPREVYLEGRLGLDQPAGWWPTPPRLKSYEAAGFSHVQVRIGARRLLSDDALVQAHAGALRDQLELTGLNLIIHAPDDLMAGTDLTDAQLDGTLRYAAIAGAGLIVYHGAQRPIGDPGLRTRLGDEERSLRRLGRRAEAVGVRIAIENLAPVYPGVELASHNPLAVYDLVRRLDSRHIGMCLDVGHAHIAAGLAGCELGELIEPVLDRVIVFHLHDNFAGRSDALRAGGIEPVKLDLHLAPGAGTVPWGELAPWLARHPAPLQLEVHPALRPEPATLAILTREVLARDRPPAGRRC